MLDAHVNAAVLVGSPFASSSQPFDFGACDVEAWHVLKERNIVAYVSLNYCICIAQLLHMYRSIVEAWHVLKERIARCDCGPSECVVLGVGLQMLYASRDPLHLYRSIVAYVSLNC